MKSLLPRCPAGPKSPARLRRSAAWRSRIAGPALIVAGLTGAMLFGRATPAEAAIVERIVAVVGDKAILLSEIRERAKPFLARVHQELPQGAQRSAATSQLYRQLLDRMIDEELQERAASRARIAITAQEVDSAIARIAAQNGISVEDLVREALRSGMTEEEYRREVRRQVLEAKVMNLRLQGRIRVTEEDLQAEYHRVVMEERMRTPFRAAWITFESPRRATSGERKEQLRAAARVAGEARGGADFAELARRWSSDPVTRQRGGELGSMRPGRLPAAIEKVLLGLEPGQISDPVRHGDKLVIVKLLSRDPSNLPTFEEARVELENRVYVERMNNARRRWLDGLRRTTHIEVRL